MAQAAKTLEREPVRDPARRLARVGPLALGVPELEAAPGRVEERGELVVEAPDLVTPLEDLVGEPPLAVASVDLPVLAREGSAALPARHVLRLEELVEHVSCIGLRPTFRQIDRTKKGRGAALFRITSGIRYARVGACSGIAPSCWSKPSWLSSFQLSTIFPPWIRSIVTPVTVTCLPVGGIPPKSPWCVPRAV
jgi:hypothetical protein